MFGTPDNYVTYEEIEALIRAWARTIENERHAANNYRNIGEPVIEEGCRARMLAYQLCRQSLIKLIGYTPE